MATRRRAQRANRDEAFRFHLQEYQLLRAEIASLGTESVRLQVLLVSSLGLYFFFIPDLAGKFTGDFAKIVIYWLPLVLLAIVYAKHKANDDHICNVIAPYLRRIESEYSHSAIGGWETFVDGRAKETGVFRDLHAGKTVFWTLLFLIVFVAVTFLTVRDFSARP